MKKYIKIGILTGMLCLSFSSKALIVQGDLLGVFSGNDSEASIFTELGLMVTELAKVETPATSNGGLTVNMLITNGDSEPISGDWTYTGAGLVDLFIVKAGNDYAVYQYTDSNTMNMRNMGIWDTSALGNKGMSHVTAYTSAVPIPAALWLFASGLLGLLGFRQPKPEV